jgi:hypothetical protein
MLPGWLQNIFNGWPLIRANPATFAGIVVSIFVVAWLGVNYLYSVQLTNKDETIKLLDRQVADYKDKLQGATPDQAKARIDELEKRLVRLEPRGFTGDQRKILIERARNDKHYMLTISSEAGCPDCAIYAASLEDALKQAGWTVHNTLVMGVPQRPASGIAMNIPGPNNRDDAMLLRDALHAAHIDVEVVTASPMVSTGLPSGISLLITAKAN